MSSNRKKLPYRETTDTFLIYKGQIVAQDHGHYVMFPGGGLDNSESSIQAAKRECMEEVGAKIRKPLKEIIKVDWDWHPAWANNPKRKKRYKQFRGERVYLIIGKVDSFGKATNVDNDAWSGKKTMSISKCIQLVQKYSEKDHPNTYPYRVGQLAVLNMLKALVKN